MHLENFKDWRGIIETPAETILRRIVKDPNWPFTQVGRDEFVLRLKTTKEKIALWLYVGIPLYALKDYLFFGVPTFRLTDLPWAILYVYVSYHVYKYIRGVRELTIYRGAARYTYYQGERKIVENPLYNLYIHLEATENGPNRLKYTLCIKGYKVDSYRMCGFMNEDKGLRKLARQMARKHGINFFDSEPLSKYHLVHHARTNLEFHVTDADNHVPRAETENGHPFVILNPLNLGDYGIVEKSWLPHPDF